MASREEAAGAPPGRSAQPGDDDGPRPGPARSGPDHREPGAAEPELGGAEPEQGDQDLRIRLDLAYDGAGFSGWAAQPGLRTVEGVLSTALATVLRVPVRLTVAGRTDAGVHAAAQVAHLDVPAQAWQRLPGRSQRRPDQALLTRLAGVLAREAQEQTGQTGQGGRAGQDGRPRRHGRAEPRGASDLVVHRAQVVSPDFDARFSALERRYTYRIADAGSPRDPRRRGHVLWLPEALDVKAMAASAEALLGEHDFLAYCKPRQGATTIRTLKRLAWRRVPAGEPGPDGGLVTLDVVADAFCHSMVRSLVGAGLEVAVGRRPASWPAELLASRSRRAAAPVAPAHGLTLEAVAYPRDEELAERAHQARRTRSLGATGECC